MTKSKSGLRRDNVARDVQQQMIDALELALPHIPYNAIHPVLIRDEPMANCLITDFVKRAIKAGKQLHRSKL